MWELGELELVLIMFEHSSNVNSCLLTSKFRISSFPKIPALFLMYLDKPLSFARKTIPFLTKMRPVTIEAG